MPRSTSRPWEHPGRKGERATLRHPSDAGMWSYTASWVPAPGHLAKPPESCVTGVGLGTAPTACGKGKLLVGRLSAEAELGSL